MRRGVHDQTRKTAWEAIRKADDRKNWMMLQKGILASESLMMMMVTAEDIKDANSTSKNK